MANCDCNHEPACHESATGACLAINPVFGACPCAATPANVAAVLDHVSRTYLRPEYQRLQNEAKETRQNAHKQYDELMGMLSKYMRGTDAEVAEMRAQVKMADRLLNQTPGGRV